MRAVNESRYRFVIKASDQKAWASSGKQQNKQTNKPKGLLTCGFHSRPGDDVVAVPAHRVWFI